jgi:hypothetical protein
MTATAYKSVRNFRRTSKSLGKLSWKKAIIWCVVFGIAGFFALNLVYQVLRKPGEIFAPFSASQLKSPEYTWQSYGVLFEKHSTAIVSPEFLAALAQVESDGNPIARPGWRWQWAWSPFEIYRPASSALGMFQITDGTFEQARKYCIHGHTVVSDGPWDDFKSCWFNGLYARIVASHATEMTAAYLHRSVVDILATRRRVKVSPAQKQQLAAVIHLCGVKRGEAFAARRFRAKPGERCGTHSLRRYLTQIDLIKKRFARLAGN